MNPFDLPRAGASGVCRIEALPLGMDVTPLVLVV